MTPPAQSDVQLSVFDDATRSLVRLAALITAADDSAIRDAMGTAVDAVPDAWIEELLLQTYLFAGFPRALNATREWRRLRPNAPADADVRGWAEYRQDGERTCAMVYGVMYEKLRENVRALHDRLDEWMIVEGYGKVLSRPGLDLARRELCIVAACAAANQDRQLHSHLHGALNVGVTPDVVGLAIGALADLLGPDRSRSVQMLWARVRGK